MYFYHEGYHEAYCADRAPEGQRDRREDHRSYEPVRSPAILHWFAIVTVALCVALTAFDGMS